MTEPIVPQWVVDEIRRVYERGGVSQSRLAARYDIGESTLFRIIHRLGAYKAATIIDPEMPIPEGEKKELDEMMKRLLKRQEEKMKKNSSLD